MRRRRMRGTIRSESVSDAPEAYFQAILRSTLPLPQNKTKDEKKLCLALLSFSELCFALLSFALLSFAELCFAQLCFAQLC